MLKDIAFKRKEIQFSYKQQDTYVFTDLSDYSELSLNSDDISAELPYITEEVDGIHAMVADGRVLGLELPPVVELEIAETGPSMKGASATARTKPATLSTGLVVQVPEYISTGETVRVDTRTGKYLSRS